MFYLLQVVMTPSASLLLVVAVLVKGDDQSTGDSSLHYTYDHSYGYADHHTPHHGYTHKYGHHHVGHGYADGYHHAYGHHVAHDYAPAYGYGHPPAPLHLPAPHHHGFVPQPHDHVEGRAYGHDLVGPFYHHSGPFGPFGFYANFFHD